MQGAGFRVQGAGFRLQGLGFRVVPKPKDGSTLNGLGARGQTWGPNACPGPPVARRVQFSSCEGYAPTECTSHTTDPALMFRPGPRPRPVSGFGFQLTILVLTRQLLP